MSHARLVLFDIDGTLLWSDGAGRRAIHAALVEVFGYQGFTVVLGIASFALAVPAFLVARMSTRLQRTETPVAVAEQVAA